MVGRNNHRVSTRIEKNGIGSCRSDAEASDPKPDAETIPTFAADDLSIVLTCGRFTEGVGFDISGNTATLGDDGEAERKPVALEDGTYVYTLKWIE